MRFSETCEIVLSIEKVNFKSEGKYICSAKNVAGFDSKSLQLTVTGEPQEEDETTLTITVVFKRREN